MSKTIRTIRKLAIAAVLGIGTGVFAAGSSLQAQEDEIGDGEGSYGHHHRGSTDGITWCHCDEYDSACKGCHDSEPSLQ